MGAGPAVRLFGAVTVECDGRRVSAGGPRPAGVLSVLALSTARPVSVDRLIDAVWGDDPPNSATNAIQVYVSALRKLLRASGLGITRRVIAVRAALDVELDRVSAAIGAGLEALRLTITSNPDPVTQASVLRILGAAWSAAGDIDTAARCDGAATAILQRAGAPVDSATLARIERHLDASRKDLHAQSVARIAALDPGAVIDDLLARSGP